MGDLQIDEKNLLFSFQVRDCILNIPGSYYLKLSIQCEAANARELLKKIKVWPGNDNDLAEESVSTVTSTVDITQANKHEPQKFTDGHFTFRLPKGLCSPNASRQIGLLAEVFPYSNNDLEIGSGSNVGQAVFVVYPRTSTPFLKLRGASGGDELYRYRGTLNLKSLSKNGLALLRGRLNYQLNLKVEPKNEPEPQPEIEPDPEPPPTPLAKTAESPPQLRPKTNSLPTQLERPASYKTWHPRKEFNPRRGSDLLRESHVSRHNQEEILIIIHAVADLPRLPDGSAPKTYVVGRSENAVEETPMGICSTHCAQSASISPTWEEAIRITVPIETGESGHHTPQEVKLQIIHEPSRTVILDYRLPLQQLQPFHHYHLDLVQDETHFFITVLRRLPALTRLQDGLLQSQDALGFHGLEVLLLGVEEHLANPVGPLIAAARLIPDLFSYRQQTTERNLQGLSVVPLTVEYPDPHPSSFLIPMAGVRNGHPQVSLVGQPEDQPNWYHAFLFTHPRELASVFTDVAALSIQFYPASSAFKNNTWTLHSPSGYCAQLLDTRVFQALQSERGGMGIRASLLIQGDVLKTKDNRTPHVAVVLRLISSRKPDSLATASDVRTLPTLPTFFEHEVKSPEPVLVTPSPPPSQSIPVPPPSQSIPVPRQSLVPLREPVSTPPPIPLHSTQHEPRKNWAMDDDELPSYNALRDLLPSKQRNGSTRHSDSGLIPTRLPPSPDPYRYKERKPKPSSAPTDNYDKYSLSLMDAQQKEISSYREALNRMGEEIVRLQEHVSRLESDNSKLRQRINMYEDAAKAMVANDDLDEITKSELLEKYMVVRQKLSRQVSETSNYRDRLLQLQNDMIKQNDREQTYLSQQEMQSTQSTALQEKQSKIKKLEKTCREQEKALEKMEQLLISKRSKNSKQEDFRRNDTDLVVAENARLKVQIEQIRLDSATKTSKNNEGEKLMMQLQLEKAKSRVQSLERELMEKARDWGKQKESMRLRMGEPHQGYNHQRALPPLRDRGYNHYSDDEIDRDLRRIRHNSPPMISYPYL